MTKFLSKSLTAEFIHLDGLQRLTSVTAHDWDLYLFKELVDNALDADEADPEVSIPHVRVVISYSESVRDKERDRSLSIKVTNQSRFPLDRIADVFDFQKRASVKSYYSNPTRGAQGNALKTVLGIPYALRNHYFSDYSPDRIPLSIAYGNLRAVVQLHIDELSEQVELRTVYEKLEEDDEPQSLTTVHVNVGRFLQQRPRTVDQLMGMAQAFALFNPHANFEFEFVFTLANGKYTRQTFQADGKPDWYGRYDHSRPAPIQWYGLNKFRQLVFALWRSNQDRPDFQLAEILSEFGVAKCPSTQEFDDSTQISQIIRREDSLQRLYELLRDNSQSKNLVYLGEIGERHLISCSDIAISPVDQTPLFFYRKFTTTDPILHHPFTLEVALYGNQLGKRRVIVGINHTTTYADPFFNKPLMPPEAKEPTKSLEKLLDYYELREETSITLALHLIAPNITYENYGKSAISDEPYRDIVTRLVHEIVQEYREAIRLPEPMDYLSEPALQLLPVAVRHFEGNQFTELQLLYQLKRLLTDLGNEHVEADMRSPNADSRLQSIIVTSHRENQIIGLLKRQSGRLAVPRHDKDTINIAFSTTSVIDIVQQFHIRSIVITSNPSIEEVLIACGYALSYDIGILRSDGNLGAAIDLLIEKYKNILANSNPDDDILLPQLWIVRDATLEAIRQTRVEVSTALQRYQMKFDQIYDLGLHPAEAKRYSWVEYQPSETALPVDRSQLHDKDEIEFYVEQLASARLESLAPQDLEEWFKGQLRANELSLKALPDTNRLNTYAVEKLRHGFRLAVADLAFEHHNLDNIQERLTKLWRTDKPSWSADLHRELQTYLTRNPRESWSGVLDITVQNLLRDFLKEKHSTIMEWIQG